MESGVLKEGFLLLTLNEKEYYFLERPVFAPLMINLIFLSDGGRLSGLKIRLLIMLLK